MRRYKILAFVNAAVASLVAMSARADTLPLASTLAHCVANHSFVDDPVSCSFGALDSASASLTTAPFVSMTAQAFSPPTLEPRGAGANADVTYSFQVLGGNLGDIVPLLIATSLTTLSTESD